jgi:preprotein translocase subunit SecF
MDKRKASIENDLALAPNIKKTIHITRHLKWYIIGASVIIVIGLIFGIIYGGLNLGIDYTGGTLMTVDMGKEYNVNDVRDVLAANGFADAPVVTSVSNTGAHDAIIRMQERGTPEEQRVVRENIIKGLQAKYPDAKQSNAQRVGGVASSELVRNTMLAILVASVLILLYVGIRFKLIAGVAAVTALLHDILIMTAFVIIFRIQVNSPYIAAVLTILGYSINDTIVVFDRIRENEPKFYPKILNRFELTDLSIKQTMVRSINSSMTVLMSTVALYIFGVDSIKEFALPMIIGIVSGTYSSIFVAAPIWAWWKDSIDFKKGLIKTHSNAKPKNA